MKRFKELIVWQKAMDLVVEVYTISKQLPIEEKFGLNSQIRIASVSIAANIAEGTGRGSQREFKHFLSIAFASSTELETEFMIIERVALIQSEKLKQIYRLIEEVQKMLNGLLTKITTDLNKS